MQTFKFRLAPSKSQRTKLLQTLALCRWIFNKTLATRKRAWEQEKKSFTRFDTIKRLPMWKVQKPELSQVYSQVLQDVCTRVDLAFQSYFRRVKEHAEKVGYPRFKGYGRYDSFTYPSRQWFDSLQNWHAENHPTSPPRRQNQDLDHSTGCGGELVCLLRLRSRADSLAFQ